MARGLLDLRRIGPLMQPSFAGLLALSLFAGLPAARAQADTDKLRIIVFGAHPDDAQFKTGGS